MTSKSPCRMCRREIKQILRRQGWRVVRQTASHEIWESPAGRRCPITAGHESQGIAAVIVSSLRKAGAVL